MEIYCVECGGIMKARLTSGEEIYPHRPDLHALPFWKCDACKNHVGCHHKTAERNKPLGNIPTKELRSARNHIHALLDPLWKGKRDKRGNRGRLYKRISSEIGYEYHTGEIKTMEEARKIYIIIKNIANEIRRKACS